MKPKQEKNEGLFGGLRDIGILTMIPMVLVAGLIVGYLFGSWVDKTFGLNPWGKVVLSVLGIIAGVKQTIRLIRETTKENGGSAQSTK